MALKITIIGGGSAYAPGLVRAFLENAGVFAGAELALMDTADAELEIVYQLTKKMLKDSSLGIKAYTNRKEAIAGAHYVLTSFRHGGFQARHEDESIPLKYNIIGQETVGPGGFFFAMRNLPVIKAIVSEMKQLAPDALLLNYSNPTQIVAEAVHKFSDVPCISICDQTKADLRNILHALSLEGSHGVLESSGLNHATWSTKFLIDGQDGVNLMTQACDAILARPDVSDRVKRQFILTREYGSVPNSYMQYYYYKEDCVREAKAADKTRAQVIMDRLPGYYRHFKEQAKLDYPRLEHVRGGSLFGDMAVDVLKGFLTQDASIHTLNVPNRGALPDFAYERIVEVSACLNIKGATPLVQKPLASERKGLLLMLAEYQALAAAAIWNEDESALVKALAANPLVMSLPVAKELLAEIISLQFRFLPEAFL